MILDLQICDPAMGSGTFPVAAIRFLTDALKESFEEYVFPEVDEGEPIAAPLGDTAKGYLNERLLKIRKGENEDWQDRLEMQLKRSVVERCIYGVDINPLAVELGKLSLWIETLDPELPFTFLDHKLRVGNSLIGAWLHEFEHYPVAAWNREGGDGQKGDRTKRINDFRNGEMRNQMQTYIRENINESHWFEPDSADKTEDLLQQVRESFEDLHESVDEGERERLYQEEFQENEDIQKLRYLMDRWCAVWFWPMHSDDSPILDPNTFYNSSRDEEIDSIVGDLSNDRKLQFFHWELEFPDVFSGSNWGFDAMLGNPPWENIEKKSLEFFTRYRPEFRTYGKRQANQIRKELFETQPEIEREWYDYVGHHEGIKNYAKFASDPWDAPLGRGKKGTQLEEEWSGIRARGSPASIPGRTPYRYQGTGRPNTYKLFFERMGYLSSNSGRVGLLVPSGIYSDKGTKALRDHLIQSNQWEWTYSFENRKKVFDIDSRFKFCVIIFESGGETKEIKCRFMVHDISEWNKKESPDYISVEKSQIQRFSPENMGIMEVESQRDIEILDKIYSKSSPLSEWNVDYRQGEYNMSTDSDVFVTSEWIDDHASRVDDSGIAYNGNSIVALPLLEGRHIDSFDYQDSEHVSGHGRSAEWDRLDWGEKRTVPRYWVPVDEIKKNIEILNPKNGIINVTSASNKRTIRGGILPSYPCGHSIGIIRTESNSLDDELLLCSILNSYVLDYTARMKLQGLNASWYLISELPLPEIREETRETILSLSQQLVADLPILSLKDGELSVSVHQNNTETSPTKRAEIREELDRVIADCYDLTDEEMEWILRPNNDDPRNLWKDYVERLELLGGTGNWGTLSDTDLVEERES